MKEKTNRKQNPTSEESRLAMEMQKPIDESIEETKPVSRGSTFQQLAKFSRSARLAFGGATQWIQPSKLFNPQYEGGLISPPFFVTKAFRYNSKQGYGERLGMEIVFANGSMHLIALGLNEGDIKRNNMIAMFEGEAPAPIGPFCLTMLPTNKGNDYYDLIPYEKGNETQSDVVPFVEIPDSDVPF